MNEKEKDFFRETEPFFPWGIGCYEVMTMDASEYTVWQRVLEEPRQEALGAVLHRLAGQSRRAIRDYRVCFRGRGNAGRELERWEGENLEALLGLFRLSVGRPMDTGAVEQDGRNPEGGFLFGRALEQLQEYTALSAQPRFGVVFGEMALRQRQICDRLTRLVGGAPGK